MKNKQSTSRQGKAGAATKLLQMSQMVIKMIKWPLTVFSAM